MIATIKRAWQDTPDDAVRVAVVALLMPVFFILYNFAPTQFSARLVFSLCLGMLGVLVGWLLQERRDTIGSLITSLSIGSTIAAVGSLFAIDDPTWTWRTVMAGTQANVVLGWFLLWRVRVKWLSRSIAACAFAVSALGFGLYLLSNFGLPDPALADPRTWGWTEPKGVLRRAIDLPLEPALGIALWASVLWQWRHFLRGHNGSERG